MSEEPKYKMQLTFNDVDGKTSVLLDHFENRAWGAEFEYYGHLDSEDPEDDYKSTDIVLTYCDNDPHRVRVFLAKAVMTLEAIEALDGIADEKVRALFKALNAMAVLD